MWGLGGVHEGGPCTRWEGLLMLFFNALDRETKELLLNNIFVITRRYKMVEIRQ